MTDKHDPSGTPEKPPRTHHFKFAKLVLPQLALLDPERFIARFADSPPRAAENLRALWHDVGLDLPEVERLPGDGLIVTSIFRPPLGTVMIELPLPEARNECFFFAACLQGDDLGALRTFGLERAVVSSLHPNGTSIVEWSRVGRSAYDNAPQSGSLVKFMDRIEEIEKTSESPMSFTDLRALGWCAT